MVRVRSNIAICALLVILTVAVYWPVRGFDFVDYDDPQFIEKNEIIRSGLNWTTIQYAFTTPVVGNWHPVTTLSHAFDCQLFGAGRPGEHHMVSVIIHAANAALLFLVMMRLMGGVKVGVNSQKSAAVLSRPNGAVSSVPVTWPCVFVAALFAFHPLRAESVAWIAERKDMLSGLFFMLTLWAYVSYCSRSSPAKASKRGKRFFYLLSTAFFTLGLMSKPMLVTLPFVLLLLDYWPLNRMQGLSARHATGILLEKVPFLILAAVSSALTLWTQQSALASNVGADLKLRVANAIISYGAYLKKFFWPSDLAVFYPYRLLSSFGTTDGLVLGISALLLFVVTIFAVLAVRSKPYLFVGWFWFLGMMVPVIGLVQVGGQSMADRYTYLPMIGLSVAGTWGAIHYAARHQRTLMVLTSLAVTIIVACVVLTRNQLGYWRGTIPLFEHTMRVTGDNTDAEFALGVGLYKAGRLNEAIERFRSVVAKDPGYVEAQYTLGFVLAKQKRWDEAVSHFLFALERTPDHFEARSNLATALAELGHYRGAVAEYEKALNIRPDSAEVLNNCAWLLATAPAPDVVNGARAVELAERACRLSAWKSAAMVGTLAAAYARAGRFDEAVKTGETARALAEKADEPELAGRNKELTDIYRARRSFTENLVK